MAEPLESVVGVLNYVPQPTKGTLPTGVSTAVGTNRPKWLSGQFDPRKALGSAPYIDGRAFSSPQMFTEAVGGDVGEVTIQVQPENAGLFFARLIAADVVTGASDPYTHTIATGTATGKYGAWYQKTGVSIGPVRQVYYDSKISKLKLEAGAEQTVLQMALGVMALKAGEVYTTDATKTEDDSDSYVRTESAVTFDGLANFCEVKGDVLEIDRKITASFGDPLEACHLLDGKAEITRALATIVTDETLLRYYKALYNTTTPTAATRPVDDIFYASITRLFTRSATRTLSVLTPKVAIKSDAFEIGPRAEGGEIPIEFGGVCLASGATPALTVVALSGDATTYAV